MESMTDLFGSLVFDDRVMKKMLSPEVYASLKKTIDEGAQLDGNVASAVAEAMKMWATEHGATHFTHWCQPLTSITAEKHDSAISPGRAAEPARPRCARSLRICRASTAHGQDPP